MKKLLNLIFSFALLALSVPAFAQSSGPHILIAGGTNNIATATTNTIASGASLAIAEFDHVGLQISAKLNGAGTDSIVIKFAVSGNGSDFETTPSQSMTLVMNGTNTVTKFADLTLPSAASIRYASNENPSSSSLTNLTVTFFLKSPKRFPRQ